MSKPLKFILVSSAVAAALSCAIFAPFVVLAYQFACLEDEMQEDC